MSGGKTVFELRVHGVSGTPPEAMLHCPAEFLTLEKGDRDAAFYRRADWIDDAASPPAEGQWRRRMEAYSWGGLTSRRASRALWVLLLPFSLINLAHWMLPPTHRRAPAVMVVAVLRLLALSFTMTLLLAMAVAILDISVWQCASLPFCSSGWGPLAYFSQISGGARLALGSLPLVAVIVVLWLRGREESSPVSKHTLPPAAVVAPGATSPLADENFWNRDPAVPRLRACHVAAWAAALGMLLLAVAVHYADTGGNGVVNQVLFGVNALIFAVAVIATGWNKATGRGGDPAGQWVHIPLMVLRWVALAVLGATLVWVAFWAGIPDHVPASYLPGLRPAIYGLLGAQGILLVLAFAGTALSTRGNPAGPEGYRPTLAGFTGPFVALLGWLLGGALSVGVGSWTAQILGTLVFSADDVIKDLGKRSFVLAQAGRSFEDKFDAVTRPTPLIVPLPYLWTSIAIVVMLSVALVVAIILWRKVSRLASADRPDATPFETDAAPEVRRRIGGSRALAGLTDAGPTMIGGLAVTGLVLFGVTGVVLSFLGHIVPAGSALTAPFLAAPVFMVVALVVLAVQGVRNRQVRRVVAILWDVVTFWPRSTHPLTLPSYGGRTVLDLRLRLAELRTSAADGSPATRTMLVAHSQGTIVAAATLMQCNRPEEQYPLLTFGTPLRRLYAVNFPAYFGYSAMTAFRESLSGAHPRWINLWSDTDPIGGWVFDPTAVHFVDDARKATMTDALADVDRRILDLPQEDPANGAYGLRGAGPLCGHGGFWDRDEYTRAVRALQELVVPGDEGRVTSATAPPVYQAM